MDLFETFDTGSVTIAGKRTDIGRLAWNPHKEFPGVFLKNLVTADQTDRRFTCHLVRIEPGHAIGMHTHPASVELHEVVRGSGLCLTEQGEIPYVPGVMALLACSAPHEIRAGENGLCLFAKFVTAQA